MKVILCGTCEGHGQVKNDLGRGDWEYIKCIRCEGKGKLLSKEYSLDIEIPFTTNATKLNKLYKLDSEICDTLQKLQRESNSKY